MSINVINKSFKMCFLHILRNISCGVGGGLERHRGHVWSRVRTAKSTHVSTRRELAARYAWNDFGEVPPLRIITRKQNVNGTHFSPPFVRTWIWKVKLTPLNVLIRAQFKKNNSWLSKIVGLICVFPRMTTNKTMSQTDRCGWFILSPLYLTRSGSPICQICEAESKGESDVNQNVRGRDRRKTPGRREGRKSQMNRSKMNSLFQRWAINVGKRTLFYF